MAVGSSMKLGWNTALDLKPTKEPQCSTARLTEMSLSAKIFLAITTMDKVCVHKNVVEWT